MVGKKDGRALLYMVELFKFGTYLSESWTILQRYVRPFLMSGSLVSSLWFLHELNHHTYIVVCTSHLPTTMNVGPDNATVYVCIFEATGENA